jgi:hypothetical protein
MENYKWGEGMAKKRIHLYGWGGICARTGWVKNGIGINNKNEIE